MKTLLGLILAGILVGFPMSVTAQSDSSSIAAINKFFGACG